MLREACFNGEDEAAARIIRRQPSLVTEVDQDGLSLLGIALLKANVGCVRLLLENGADPNIAKAAAAAAARRQRAQHARRRAALEPRGAGGGDGAVRLLLEHSADPNYNGRDALKHVLWPDHVARLDAKGTPDASHVSSVIGKNTADTVRPPPVAQPAPPRRALAHPADTVIVAASQVAAVVLRLPHRRSLRQRPQRGFESYAAHARRVPQPAALHQGAI